MCAAITSRPGGMLSIGTRLLSYTMQRRSRIFPVFEKRKAPDAFGGFFFLLQKIGMESELSHHLSLGQWNNGHGTSGGPIIPCHGCNSRYPACRHGHGYAAGGMPRSFANQLHAATHVEFREQRLDMKFYGAFGEIQAG